MQFPGFTKGALRSGLQRTLCPEVTLQPALLIGKITTLQAVQVAGSYSIFQARTGLQKDGLDLNKGSHQQ